MGKSFRTLILAMTATVAVASCTENEPENLTRTTEDSKVYLKIGSVSTSELTKSAIEGAKFPTADAASIGLFIGNINNKEFSKPAGSDTWSDPQIELPAEETTLYGYYPYSEDVTSISSISVSSSVDGDDWMWATPVEKVSSSNPEVSLSMNHALALVEVTFNVMGHAEGSEMTALTLTAGSFSQTGTLNATDGTVTPGTDATGGCQLLAENQTLTLEDGVIVAKCLLVPTGSDELEDMAIACTLDGKNLKASLTGSKGVLVKSGYKSTVSLNVKGTTMEVAEVGVSGWNDGATTAIVGGHTVTVTGNVPAEISAALDITADDESVETVSQTATIRYDKSVLNDGVCELVYSVEPASCRIDHNAAAGILTVSDVTKDIEIALSTKVADWDEVPVISGTFTVDGSGRKVRFSTGLLYWDGDSFEIESGQLSFYGYYLDTSHISHFFWSKDPAVSCQAIYSDSGASADDVLFTNSTVTAANPDFTAGELKGFWRALSNAEWNYLINTRVVNGGTGEGHTCVKATINERPGLIIFCDGYTGETENLTSIPEGCAFLPICGYRRDESIQSANMYGYCWSSTSSSGNQAYCVNFRNEVKASVANDRKYGFPVRLVVDVTE
ncbi:MAG: fimbrillin family protein [Bacteroidaceae bacterium]|nr:fimbrillin family protein [Bacteroidaceae bacterium]